MQVQHCNFTFNDPAHQVCKVPDLVNNLFNYIEVSDAIVTCPLVSKLWYKCSKNLATWKNLCTEFFPEKKALKNYKIFFYNNLRTANFVDRHRIELQLREKINNDMRSGQRLKDENDKRVSKYEASIPHAIQVFTDERFIKILNELESLLFKNVIKDFGDLADRISDIIERLVNLRGLGEEFIHNLNIMNPHLKKIVQKLKMENAIDFEFIISQLKDASYNIKTKLNKRKLPDSADTHPIKRVKMESTEIEMRDI